MEEPIIHPDDEVLRLLSIKQVRHIVPVSKMTLYRWMEAGKFPRPIVNAGGLNFWSNGDIAAWERANAKKQRNNGDLV